MLARVTNPLSLLPVAISALLAGAGVTGIVMARRTLARAETPPEQTPTPMFTFVSRATFTGGSGGMEGSAGLSDAETVRTKPYGYTSWFKPVDEQTVIGMLQRWRAEHGTGSCDLVFKNVPRGTNLEQVSAYISASATAAKHVLDTMWPNGKPWHADWFWQTGPDVQAASRKGIDMWRAWLWWRVYSLANRYVCGMVPVT